jgi:integral membrane sensor domain MASE1
MFAHHQIILSLLLCVVCAAIFFAIALRKFKRPR